MLSFRDKTVTRYCGSSKSLMMASQKRNFNPQFDLCDIKDVEFIKPPRYKIMDNLAMTCQKPKQPSHILLAMEDGLYLLSQRERIDQSLKWKPISNADRDLYREVMQCIHFDSCMSSIGIGTAESHVPTEIRELCLERFRNSMCDVGLCTKPTTNTFGIQTRVETQDVASQLLIEKKDAAVTAITKTTDRSVQAKYNTTNSSTATDNLASGDKPGITVKGPSSSIPCHDGMSKGDDFSIQNTKISIEIKGKSPGNNNIASVKIQGNSEVFTNSEEFSISDEDFSTIFNILKKSKKKSENHLAAEEQVQTKTSTPAEVPVEGFSENGDVEYYRALGAIPKNLKKNNNHHFQKKELPIPAYLPMPVEMMTDTGVKEEKLISSTPSNPSARLRNRSSDQAACLITSSNRCTSMHSKVTFSSYNADKFDIPSSPRAVFSETYMLHTSSTFHLDHTPEEQPYNPSYSPFMAFGFHAESNVPITLADVNVPYVEKHHIILNHAGSGVNELGSGSFGCVYMAKHVLRKDHICIKDYDMETVDLYEVIMEAKVLLYLKSTGVVPECIGLLESSLNANDLLLVQECYAGGFTLQKMLTNCPALFNHNRWMNLCLQLLVGLYRIHSLHVLINDIKWDNVLVDVTSMDPKNCIRYIDFGLATFREGRIYHRDPYYMQQFRYLAPEVKNGMPTTPATDLYSLGCILEDIYTYTSIDAINEIAARCLRPDPNERPATLELIEQVKTICDSLD